MAVELRKWFRDGNCIVWVLADGNGGKFVAKNAQRNRRKTMWATSFVVRYAMKFLMNKRVTWQLLSEVRWIGRHCQPAHSTSLC
jgi:hypothetical protein